MNRKQLVFMWCGIVTIILITLPFALDWLTSYREQDKIGGLFFLIFYVALITGGLIVSFKGRKPQVKLNVKKGFKRITFVLSLLAFTFWVALGIIEGCISKGDVGALWIGPLIGLAFFTGIWVIYGIVFWVITPIVRWVANWIAKGFEYEPKKPQDD